LTLRVIDWLHNQQKIKLIRHPVFDNCVNHELAKRFFNVDKNGNTMYPPIFNIIVKCSKSKLSKILASENVIKFIEHKTSFGTEKSRINPWTQKEDDDCVAFRLYIGYQDVFDNIICGLSKILEMF
jgi:cystathionine beta-lyase/cystathionine gamma-synthase